MSRHAGPYTDPVTFVQTFWPSVYLYDKQREIMYSVRDNVKTVVHAGNMLGKDFVAALVCLWFFLTRHPCRVVTTSVDGTQLEAVLWGEIRRFIQSSVIPLDSDKGGPLFVNHLHLRKIPDPKRHPGVVCGLSYMLGRVARRGEGMLGHHAYPEFWDGLTPHTLFVADEASGVEDTSYDRADTWAKRMLVIGNPYETQNFFRRLVKKGDVRVPVEGKPGHAGRDGP